MSKTRIIPLDQKAVKSGRVAPRRWLMFAALGAVGILALAYFDGGEEPIHPISQQIAHPAGLGTSQ